MGLFLLLHCLQPVSLVEIYLKEGTGRCWTVSAGGVARCRCTGAEEAGPEEEVVVGPSTLPSNIHHLQVENCAKLTLETKLLNQLPQLVNITVRDVENVVIQQDLFETRGAGGLVGSVDTIEIHNVRNLQVRRYAFRGLEVRNRFYLGEVTLTTIVPMAFTFDYVKEFSIFASRIDRISMWGIKLARCGEFNVLGMTHFSSLAAHAIKARCHKFSLAYNWFGHLHDSSFEVEYGLSDIQGNTFVSLGGKPFLDLRPIPAGELLVEGESAGIMTGFVFRENKFTADPALPFGSLVMPGFSQILRDSAYIDIDSNQFSCECEAVGWLMAFGQLGYNNKTLADISKVKGTGTVEFLTLLYSSAGQCLKCSHDECRSLPEKLVDLAHTSLIREGSVLRCSSGVVIKNNDDLSVEQDLLVLPKSWKEDNEKTESVTESTITTPPSPSPPPPTVLQPTGGSITPSIIPMGQKEPWRSGQNQRLASGAASSSWPLHSLIFLAAAATVSAVN